MIEKCKGNCVSPIELAEPFVGLFSIFLVSYGHCWDSLSVYKKQQNKNDLRNNHEVSL